MFPIYRHKINTYHCLHQFSNLCFYFGCPLKYFHIQLNRDSFYSATIKNIALSCDNHVTSGTSPKPGLTMSQFGSVTDLLRHIQDMNLALSITKWLAKQLQTGVFAVGL